jgi:phospholipid transport system substrate-binding protein
MHLIGRTLTTLAMLAFIGVGAMSSGHAKNPEAQAFVEALSEEALALVKTDRPEAEQREDFAKLLDTYFDMRGIAQFLVGRYWRTASADERDAYYEAFRESIVTTYTRRFGDYSGQVMDVTGSREDGRFVLVNSQIVSPDGTGQPVNVDWRVLEQDGGKTFKVVDVVIEGVSMSVTQRQEYTSVIQNKGGKLSALTDALNKTSRVN